MSARLGATHPPPQGSLFRLGELGDEALGIVEEVFITSEDPVHGLVSAFTVSVGVILQWLLMLLLWCLWLLRVLVLLLLLLLHDMK